ncbi:MAG: 30S ribosomal protein S17 [Alphaproteobacteria bacterium]|nr:30S ribosomal protein S17 [Alphaproteobacteria bacterium]
MPRRVLEGDVVSNKTDKTITVLVERRYRHPVYKKYIKTSDKYAAHDESNACQIGDRVQIIECRPISKTKRWTLLTDGAGAAVADISAPKAAAEAKPKKTAAAKAPAKKTTAKKKDA